MRLVWCVGREKGVGGTERGERGRWCGEGEKGGGDMHGFVLRPDHEGNDIFM